MEIILLKQGEMILKGANRRSFELRLEQAVRRLAEPYGSFTVRSQQSVVFVEPQDGADVSGAFEALKHVFGIVSLTRALACDKSLDAIVDAAKTYLADAFAVAKSFKVETKRADKRFPMPSIQVSQYVGGELNDAFPGCAVDVRTPELTVGVEIREDNAFVHGNAVRGAGGLPPGTAGRAVVLLSGGIDSPVAAYMAARRGLSVIPLHFYSYPYTSEAAKQKVLDIAAILTRYCGAMNVELVPFTEIQEAVAKNCPEEFATVIARRFMTAIADELADKYGALALVTGENLGQVASQTMEALAVTQQAARHVVLRPLICFDKREISDWAEKIGTFATSILPYEDCCTVFTPRRPATKPKLERVLEAERALDRETLIREAVSRIERIPVR